MALTDVWFLLIAVLWTGYFVLEGFDFGVGMLLPLVGAPTPTGASRSTRSARSGTATRCGSWWQAGRRSPRSPSGTRACSPASTRRSCWSSSRSSCAGSRSSTAARSTATGGGATGTSRSCSARWCPRCWTAVDADLPQAVLRIGCGYPVPATRRRPLVDVVGPAGASTGAW